MYVDVSETRKAVANGRKVETFVHAIAETDLGHEQAGRKWKTDFVQVVGVNIEDLYIVAAEKKRRGLMVDLAAGSEEPGWEVDLVIHLAGAHQVIRRLEDTAIVKYSEQDYLIDHKDKRINADTNFWRQLEKMAPLYRHVCHAHRDGVRLSLIRFWAHIEMLGPVGEKKPRVALPRDTKRSERY